MYRLAVSYSNTPVRLYISEELIQLCPFFHASPEHACECAATPGRRARAAAAPSRTPRARCSPMTGTAVRSGEQRSCQNSESGAEHAQQNNTSCNTLCNTGLHVFSKNTGGNTHPRCVCENTSVCVTQKLHILSNSFIEMISTYLRELCNRH